MDLFSWSHHETTRKTSFSNSLLPQPRKYNAQTSANTPPPNPQLKDEAEQRPKHATFTTLISRGSGGKDGLNFPFIFSKIVAYSQATLDGNSKAGKPDSSISATDSPPVVATLRSLLFSFSKFLSLDFLANHPPVRNKNARNLKRRAI